MTPEPGRPAPASRGDESREAASPSSVAYRLLQAHNEPFRSPPGLPLRQFLRRNLLLGVSTLIFLGVVVLVLLQIDSAYYQDRKRDLLRRLFIEERLREDPNMLALSSFADHYVDAYIDRPRTETPESRKQRDQDAARFAELSHKLLDVSPFLVRVTLADKNRKPIIDIDESKSRDVRGDFSNSLIPRPFVQEWTTVKGYSVNGTSLVISITAPKGNLEIERLTRTWRLYSFLILLALASLYLIFLATVLIPVRNLITALDKGPALGSPLIARPRTLLEKYYNNLARDATISVFSTAMREFVTNRQLVDEQPLIELIPGLVTELFPLEGAAIITFRHDDVAHRYATESVHNASARAPVEGEALRAIESALHRDSPPPVPAEWNASVLIPAGGDLRSGGLRAETVGAGDRHLSVLVVRIPVRKASLVPWWHDLAARAAREVRYALHAVAEQRRLILTEKSKANISLSRNIGHDLTNIIATSKLELMSLKALLEMPREDLYNSPRKLQMFRETLEALLDNTRFLQEIVNLYRSFTYLSRPKFEETDVNALVREVAALFQLSVSRAITVRTELDDQLGSIEVEPRLLRLALFNLLSNAADSIKRSTTVEKPSGEIVIRTQRGMGPAYHQIAVEDSGGGIRDAEGRLLDPHEIDAIFQLGYSTKERGTSEGLGLSWVQQIVHEFHGGEILARNRAEGGAAFVVSLPPHRLATPRPVAVSLDRSS